MDRETFSGERAGKARAGAELGAGTQLDTDGASAGLCLPDDGLLGLCLSQGGSNLSTMLKAGCLPRPLQPWDVSGTDVRQHLSQCQAQRSISNK